MFRRSFGSHFGGSLFRQLRQTKVENLRITIWPNHYVFRLDIAMDDAGLMSCRQSVGNLNRNVQGLLEVKAVVAQAVT